MVVSVCTAGICDNYWPQVNIEMQKKTWRIETLQSKGKKKKKEKKGILVFLVMGKIVILAEKREEMWEIHNSSWQKLVIFQSRSIHKSFFNDINCLWLSCNRYVDLLLGEFKHYKTRLAHGGICKEVSSSQR